MFKKILIANRGEIAVRIIRCCRELGIETVAVYSTEDVNSLHVMLADYSFCIGPATSSKSYLNKNALIEICKKNHCDAIHPGYGFLSENAEFAKMCEDNGITFIGPSSKLISSLGDKQSARKLMLESGVNVVPGSPDILENVDEAIKFANQVGYPVLLKATAGGGGKGMRKATSDEDIRMAYDTAYNEAKQAFANGNLYLEKLIVNPRHIEIQILADKFGNVICLGERDCSMQNNNQKILEESPCLILDKTTKNSMYEAAKKAIKAANYYSAGTVEFVVDRDGNFYFIEVNTRIQVEHPVTEMITGVDLIKEQIKIAAGMKLSINEDELPKEGHAIECRINAKSAGEVSFVHFPSGYNVRIDSYLYSGCTVSPFYDSMIAKIIVKGKTRLEAIKRLRRCLQELVIDGIETNAEFMHILTFHPEFIKGNYNTSFLEKNKKDICAWCEVDENDMNMTKQA